MPFFRPRWRSVLLLLAPIVCFATYAYRGAGEQAAPESVAGTPRPIGARAQGNCPEAAADTAAGMPDRAAGPRSSALEVGLTDASEPVCVYVGQALRVHLPASPATGYEWVLEDGAPQLLRLETDPGGEPASRLLRTGTASLQSWEFRAERSGHAALRFVDRRPWEALSKPARTAQFDVMVR
jgi:predicted secreted protein